MTAEAVDRRSYLGGPDVAAIVGLSRFGSKIDVWRHKVEGVRRDVTERMAWGLLLEDAIAEGYTAQTGIRLQKRRTPVLHRVYPFLGGSPDRWLVGEPGLLEVKVVDWAAAWGEGVPADVEVQCQWYLGLTGRQFADVAALMGLGRLKVERIERDDALIADLTDEALAFWLDHVVTGEAPPPDDSESYRDYLRAKFPRASGLERVATPEQGLLVGEYAALKDQQKVLARAREELENRLKAIIGDASALIGGGFRLTWQNVKDHEETDWALVAAAYRVLLEETRGELDEGMLKDGLRPEGLDAVKSIYTVTKAGERRLHLGKPKG